MSDERTVNKVIVTIFYHDHSYDAIAVEEVGTFIANSSTASLQNDADSIGAIFEGRWTQFKSETNL